jgi:hypothetical protein
MSFRLFPLFWVFFYMALLTRNLFYTTYGDIFFCGKYMSSALLKKVLSRIHYTWWVPVASHYLIFQCFRTWLEVLSVVFLSILFISAVICEDYAALVVGKWMCIKHCGNGTDKENQITHRKSALVPFLPLQTPCRQAWYRSEGLVTA